MHYIDWNQMSELGLIERINREILHPLGLAVTRNPDTGKSDMILVSDDGVWDYSRDIVSNILTNTEVKEAVALMSKQVVVFTEGTPDLVPAPEKPESSNKFIDPGTGGEERLFGYSEE